MKPNKRGPVELQLVRMAEEIRRRGGTQLCAFTDRPPPWYEALLEDAGGEYAVVPAPAAAGAGAIADLVRRRGVDLVHLHFVRPQPLAGMVRGAGAARVVLTDHVYRAPRAPVLARALVRHVRARRVDAFVAVSDYVATQIRRDYLAGGRRVRTILNGVDLELFRPPEDKQGLRASALGLGPEATVVVVACHLHARKRVDMVVRAVSELTASGDAVQLVIAGDGPERGRLQGLIGELGLAGHVRLLFGDNRVWELYGAADIGVSASDGEGIGGSPIEAMACGLPLVATACGGQAEVPEHEVTGYLVRDESPTGLADAIRRLVRDPAGRASMGRSARARAERLFDVRRAARETVELYDELLSS